MSEQDQVAELDSAETDLTAAVAAETTEIAAAFSALNDTVSNLKAAVPPEVDLSKEIEAVKSAADAVRAIYTPPAESGSAVHAENETPSGGTPEPQAGTDGDSGTVPITADPVADDTSDETETPGAAAPDADSGE